VSLSVLDARIGLNEKIPLLNLVGHSPGASHHIIYQNTGICFPPDNFYSSCILKHRGSYFKASWIESFSPETSSNYIFCHEFLPKVIKISHIPPWMLDWFSNIT
jgi:hypothetical protein